MSDLILHGDVYSCLDQLEDNSIAVAITSPPYWKQRDYGFKDQIGQEKTPEEYIGRLVTVFDKLKHKIRDDGVFFLNIGDKYLNRYGKSQLLQIPYRVGYHMEKKGWNLKDILIWYKPNHMPSPAKDRFTNTYEPILVFTKSERRSIYNGKERILRVPLQQTPWRHTAVFPERLVEEMLKRVELRSGDLILDPFAGTGTVAVVTNRIRSNSSKEISSIMIEGSKYFVSVIQERTGIKNLVRVPNMEYGWAPVREERLPEVEPMEILTDEHGEVFIANTSDEFLSALKGITTSRFKNFHREDALYFFGVKKWTLLDLYYAHSILYEGYVLRNTLVVSREGDWYPVFMFARDSTRTEYRFYLDRVRIAPKAREKRNWWKEEFSGLRVKDTSGKIKKEGRILEIIERYEDGFPKIVAVQWNGLSSLEFVLHPSREELISRGLTFKCPICNSELEEPYDPLGENTCPSCGATLWKDSRTLPRVEEPDEVLKTYEKLNKENYNLGELVETGKLKEKSRRGKETKSKFKGLERINWGASPGARKLLIGEYFTKTRLYKINQPIVAQYLNILRRNRGLSIREVTEKFPENYRHTVGHWFRKDFGGSIPVPEDISLLNDIFGIEDDLLRALGKTALKFQTVKTSINGRNPGDFIEGLNDKELMKYLEKLYSPTKR